MDLQPVTPKIERLFHAVVELGAPISVGMTPLGERRIIPITGGHFEGEQLAGEVLPGGADWQLVRADGSALLEARYTLRTRDGALVYVCNRGVRAGPSEVLARLRAGEPVAPESYYFRTTPTFETGAASYAWLNDLVAVCSAARTVSAVTLDFFAVR